MQIIVDANPLISILIKPGKPIDLFFIEELELVAPSLLFEEIEANINEIIQKSGLSKDDIIKLLFILKRKIKIIPEEDFIKFREKANAICPDEKDVTYFALSLYLKCPIWSNEKILKKQNDVKVFATHELIELFGL